MKRLYILRHAKSSWTDSNLSDFERPLNDRGEKAAPFMGRLAAERELLPAQIISSPARRAASTAELFKNAAGMSAEIRFDDRIYEASPQALYQVTSDLVDDPASAMIVGHNPGIEGFIRALTGKTERMPTAALAVVNLAIENWSEISNGCGTLVQVIRPKEQIHSTGKSN